MRIGTRSTSRPPTARPLARPLSFLKPIVLAVITLMCVAGSYAIQNSDGSLMPFLTRPLSVTMMVIILLVIFGPALLRPLTRARARARSKSA